MASPAIRPTGAPTTPPAVFVQEATDLANVIDAIRRAKAQNTGQSGFNMPPIGRGLPGGAPSLGGGETGGLPTSVGNYDVGGGWGFGEAGGIGAGGEAAGTTAGSAPGSSGGFGSLGSFGPAAAIVAAVIAGKKIEKENQGNWVGDTALSLTGPDASQIFADPKGTGLPTALGAPFLLPWTASKKSKHTDASFLPWLGL